MAVRAKFFVKSVSFNHLSRGDLGRPDLPMFDLVLEPVNNCSLPQPDPEDEDSAFGYWTPSGQLTMTVRGDVARHFVPGSVKYVDFVDAPA